MNLLNVKGMTAEMMVQSYFLDRTVEQVQTRINYIAGNEGQALPFDAKTKKDQTAVETKAGREIKKKLEKMTKGDGDDINNFSDDYEEDTTKPKKQISAPPKQILNNPQ